MAQDLSKMTSAQIEALLTKNANDKDAFLKTYREKQKDLNTALAVALDKETAERAKNPAHAAKSQKVGG